MAVRLLVKRNSPDRLTVTRKQNKEKGGIWLHVSGLGYEEDLETLNGRDSTIDSRE
jgi:hypothetical protein